RDVVARVEAHRRERRGRPAARELEVADAEFPPARARERREARLSRVEGRAGFREIDGVGRPARRIEPDEHTGFFEGLADRADAGGALEVVRSTFDLDVEVLRVDLAAEERMEAR